MCLAQPHYLQYISPCLKKGKIISSYMCSARPYYLHTGAWLGLIISSHMCLARPYYLHLCARLGTLFILSHHLQYVSPCLERENYFHICAQLGLIISIYVFGSTLLSPYVCSARHPLHLVPPWSKREGKLYRHMYA